MSSPDCSDRCRCGMNRVSVIASCSASSASIESIDDNRSRGRSGTWRRIALHQLAERRRARQIGPIRRHIDAGQHHFAVTVRHKLPDLLDNRAHRHRARRSAAIRDDAERAAVIAPVLHLHECARAPVEPLDQVPRGLRHRHDVVDLHLVVERHAERHRPVRLGLELVGVADHEIDLGHVGERARIGLRRAAGDDDLPRRVLALRPADRLLRLPHRFGRHRAGVDDQRTGNARFERRRLHHLGFVGVEPAPEGQRLHRTRSKRLRRSSDDALACPRAGLRDRACRRTRTPPVRSAAHGRRCATRRRDRRPAPSPSPCGRCAWCAHRIDQRRARRACRRRASAPRRAPRCATMMWSRRHHLRDRDVAALREQRMVLEQRPEAVERVVVDVVLDPERDVRIAHRDRRRRVQHRRIDRPDLELDPASCRRTLRPAECPASRSGACPYRR